MTSTRRARAGLALVAALALTTSLAHAQGIEAPRVPLRTAIKELGTIRSEYADLYNKKDVAALTSMYLPDAAVIRPDGSILLGQAAIGQSLAAEAPSWKQVTITSDTMRVFGNTAWDVGKLTSPASEGDASVSHYLVVLRRGVQTWKISSLAVVPETRVTAAK